MNRIFEAIVKKPFLFILLLVALAIIGWYNIPKLPVDVFPDIAVPRVVIQTEAAGLTAEEVEQRITIPIESVMNGIPGIPNDDLFVKLMKVKHSPNIHRI